MSGRLEGMEMSFAVRCSARRFASLIALALSLCGMVGVPSTHVFGAVVTGESDSQRDATQGTIYAAATMASREAKSDPIGNLIGGLSEQNQTIGQQGRAVSDQVTAAKAAAERAKTARTSAKKELGKAMKRGASPATIQAAATNARAEAEKAQTASAAAITANDAVQAADQAAAPASKQEASKAAAAAASDANSANTAAEAAEKLVKPGDASAGGDGAGAANAVAEQVKAVTAAAGRAKTARTSADTELGKARQPGASRAAVQEAARNARAAADTAQTASAAAVVANNAVQAAATALRGSKRKAGNAAQAAAADAKSANTAAEAAEKLYKQGNASARGDGAGAAKAIAKQVNAVKAAAERAQLVNAVNAQVTIAKNARTDVRTGVSNLESAPNSRKRDIALAMRLAADKAVTASQTVDRLVNQAAPANRSAIVSLVTKVKEHAERADAAALKAIEIDRLYPPDLQRAGPPSIDQSAKERAAETIADARSTAREQLTNARRAWASAQAEHDVQQARVYADDARTAAVAAQNAVNGIDTVFAEAGGAVDDELREQREDAKGYADDADLVAQGAAKTAQLKQPSGNGWERPMIVVLAILVLTQLGLLAYPFIAARVGLRPITTGGLAATDISATIEEQLAVDGPQYKKLVEPIEKRLSALSDELGTFRTSLDDAKTSIGRATELTQEPNAKGELLAVVEQRFDTLEADKRRTAEEASRLARGLADIERRFDTLEAVWRKTAATPSTMTGTLATDRGVQGGANALATTKLSGNTARGLGLILKEYNALQAVDPQNIKNQILDKRADFEIRHGVRRFGCANAAEMTHGGSIQPIFSEKHLGEMFILTIGYEDYCLPAWGEFADMHRPSFKEFFEGQPQNGSIISVADPGRVYRTNGEIKVSSKGLINS